MIHDRYQTESSPDFLIYEFESIGPKGKVVKIVEYIEIFRSIYNLGFGDKDPQTGHVSDTTTTNNADKPKVSATVASTLYSFTSMYPEAIVSATGSTPARTRLYQIGISNNLEIIQKDFDVYGLRMDGIWEKFTRNKTYDAFSVHRKM